MLNLLLAVIIIKFNEVSAESRKIEDFTDLINETINLVFPKVSKLKKKNDFTEGIELALVKLDTRDKFLRLSKIETSRRHNKNGTNFLNRSAIVNNYIKGLKEPIRKSYENSFLTIKKNNVKKRNEFINEELRKSMKLKPDFQNGMILHMDNKNSSRSFKKALKSPKRTFGETVSKRVRTLGSYKESERHESLNTNTDPSKINICEVIFPNGDVDQFMDEVDDGNISYLSRSKRENAMYSPFQSKGGNLKKFAFNKKPIPKVVIRSNKNNSDKEVTGLHADAKQEDSQDDTFEEANKKKVHKLRIKTVESKEQEKLDSKNTISKHSSPSNSQYKIVAKKRLHSQENRFEISDDELSSKYDLKKNYSINKKTNEIQTPMSDQGTVKTMFNSSNLVGNIFGGVVKKMTKMNNI